MGRKSFIPTILIAVLALVIAVGGVGIGLAWRTNYLDKWLPPNIKKMFGRGEKPEEESFVGKIADALKLGKVMKCTWSKGEDSTVFYIKSDKYYRGEVTSKGKVGYYLHSSDYTYVWQEGEERGVKWYWTPSVGEEEMPELGEEAVGATLDYEYDCRPATVSDSMFEPPPGINFVDMSQFMQ